MMLGQPETAAEHEAEQRRMEAASRAREARDARIGREIRAAVARGVPLDSACLGAARTHRLGKGGATYARQLADTPSDPLAYDGAPRPISRAEAERIAATEYASDGRAMLSRGSDGGMHWRGDAGSPADARRWEAAKVEQMVQRIMAGECQHTVFFDRARDTFYCG